MCTWKQLLTTVLLLSSFTQRMQCELVLSPSGTLLVCGVGEQAEMTCTTTESALRWNITLPGEASLTETRLQSSSTFSSTATSLQIDSTTITFTRTTAQNSLPLTCRLRIDQVSERLNGTLINCTEVGVGLMNPDTSSAVVLIVGQNIVSVYSNPPEVIKGNTELLESDSVTLTLEWTQEAVTLLSYTVRVTPFREAAIVRSDGNSSVQLTLPYNTQFNVSVVTTLCGHTLSETTVELEYNTCDYPLLQEDVTVDNHGTPLIEGTILTIRCASDVLALTGPNVTVCTEDRKWEPKPLQTRCEVDCGTPSKPNNGYVIHYNDTVLGSKGTIACQSDQFEGYVVIDVVCHHHGNWEPNITTVCTSMSGIISPTITMIVIIAVVSSVTVFILSSILFFIIGFVSGRFSKREKSSSNVHTSEDRTIPTPSPQQSVVYEDIIAPRQHDKDLEMKENVAYGPIKSYR